MIRPRVDLRAAHLEHVLVRLHAQLVVDAHRRDHEPQLTGDLAADHAHAPQQRAGAPEPPLTSGTSPKPIASSSRRRPPPTAAPARAPVRPARRPWPWPAAAAASLCLGHAVAHRPADRAEDRGDEQERQLRQARDQREQADRAGGDHRRAALAEDLAGDVAAQVPVGGGARDDDAGRRPRSAAPGSGPPGRRRRSAASTCGWLRRSRGCAGACPRRSRRRG